MQRSSRREWIVLIAVVGLSGLVAILHGLSSTEAPVEASSSEAPSGEGSSSRQSSRLEPAGEAELALLAPLQVGATLGDWEIRFIGAISKGRLPIVVAHEGRDLGLEVVLSGDDGPEPAAATRRFHVFYRSRGALPEDGSRLALALAKVLAENGAVAPPPGMTAYRDAGRDPWADGI